MQRTVVYFVLNSENHPRILTYGAYCSRHRANANIVSTVFETDAFPILFLDERRLTHTLFSSELRRTGRARVGATVQRRRRQHVRGPAAVQQATGHRPADQKAEHQHPAGHRVVRRMAVAARRSVHTEVQHRTVHGQLGPGE